ncbi:MULTISPECIES: hypothetical protein [unclassified Microbacterium]|uniref:hypothetical protein n=1 Tax=unclassified Microbacterium TaxID=2609290 RepID=UPI00288330AA|nr:MULTISPECIES: hypothetical protein [unclassified Microbacterium]
MTTDKTPAKLFVVQENFDHEGCQNVVASFDESVADSIAKTLNAFGAPGAYAVETVPIAADLDSIRRTRLSITQQIGRDGVLGDHSERRETVWTFAPDVRIVDAEDNSTDHAVIVWGMDHEKVMDLYRTKLAARLEHVSTR